MAAIRQITSDPRPTSNRRPMNHNDQEAWRRFQRGDHISDDEMQRLIAQLQPVVTFLATAGKEYHLTWADLQRQLERLEGYLQNRQRLAAAPGLCGAWHGLFSCTREPEHDGAHVAIGLQGKVWDTWP